MMDPLVDVFLSRDLDSAILPREVSLSTKYLWYQLLRSRSPRKVIRVI